MKFDSLSEVSVFEEKHMISIMIFLNSNGPSRKIDLYEGVSSNPRMPDKLNHLEEMGLISQKMDMISRSTIVALTPSGEQVASLLIAIEKTLVNAKGKTYMS